MLYLQAVEDRLIPRSALEAIQRIHPDVQVAAFASPHFLLQVKPEETARCVGQFVRSLEPTSPDRGGGC
jgi:pimeloyl-[acyl-carrier protein] methyl ester esterase